MDSLSSNTLHLMSVTFSLFKPSSILNLKFEKNYIQGFKNKNFTCKPRNFSNGFADDLISFIVDAWSETLIDISKFL